MPDWQEIRDRVTSHPGAKLAWRGLKWLGVRSESPTSFGILAFLGVAALVVLNIRIPQAPTAHILPESELQIEQTEQVEPTPYIPPEETFALKRGETLITLLRRATINSSDAHKIVAQLKDITNLRRLRAGQEVRIVRQAEDGRKVSSLKLRDSFHEEAVVKYEDNRYKATRATIPTSLLTHYVEGEITDSLYLSAERAGLPRKVIIDLIRMMTFDVDFEREIRVGDRFEVYFERHFSPNFNDIDEGRILKAKITLQKRVLEAYFYEEENGDQGYYDASGQSTKRALMKTPLDVAVVTSSYGRRKHPVLGYTRMHKGSDFRAPTGTPIMAAGDGVVEMAARNGSYGNYVRIRHNSTYKTAYAHLSRYGNGVKKGRRVKQGQIIGYSGATGRVTGAHLHYEVLVNGRQVNPLTLDLPKGKTLTGSALEQYQDSVRLIDAEVNSIFLTKSALLEDKSIPIADATVTQ
jgi:murein DD-endopeptidase MepM/ murein hydrolase activator NlpD